jgi:hypothetical protein
LVVGASLLFVGFVAPSANELTYLVLLKRFADPTYLGFDWTFGSGFDEFFLFTRLFSPLTRVFSLELLAWIGRVATWSAMAFGLLAIGRRLGARPIFSAIGLALWLGMNQSMGVGTTRIVAEFQASTVAYSFLIGGLALALGQKVPWAMLFAGLAFAFHPGVGLWGSSFLVLVLLGLRDTRRQAFRYLWVPVVAALPGVIPQVMSLFRSGLTAGDANFIALQRIPHHADPFSFGERGPILFVAMLAFNLLLHWRWRQQFAHRLLGLVQLLGLIPVVVGVVARIVGLSSFLILLPFRVLPALVPALFFLNLAALITSRNLRELWPFAGNDPLRRWQGAVGLAAIAGTLVLWNPVIRFAGIVSENAAAIAERDTDIESALQWTATGTPTDAVVLSPPDRDDLFYLSQRAQYVSWEAIPYDRVSEWRRRLESVMPAGFFPVRRAGEWLDSYVAMPLEQLQALDPAVDYVITTATYDLPIAYSSGEWIVYQVD